MCITTTSGAARRAWRAAALCALMAASSGAAATLYSFPLDSAPGWATQGQWQFGTPHGGGTYPYDPTAGFTGSNVYGYNLAGDYANNIPRHYVTTVPLDFSRARNVTLAFRRWLGVEAASYDHASVEASNNGITWTTLWEHTGATINDTAWKLVTLPLGFVADGQSNVWVRWGMGPSDYTVTYGGWNIDDIAFEGDLSDDLAITPTGTYSVAGITGGPFSPGTWKLSLTNTGASALAWQASADAAWLALQPVGGTLVPGAGTVVTASITATANTLTAGVYAARMSFSNNVSGIVQTVPASLRVLPPGSAVLHSFALDENPGWTTQGQWAFGVPLGGGSYSHDPLSGYSGPNVYGYNLAGDYEDTSTAQFFLTTTALDCSYATGMTLRFWRWLGVGASYYDHAAVQMSTNGVTWSTLWQNGYTAINDSNWTECIYPMTMADNCPRVYLRWSMGPFSSWDGRPGWNVDDIALTAVSLEALRVTPAGTAAVSGQRGGPFTPAYVRFEVCNTKNAACTWSASANAAWLDLSNTGGTLAPGSCADVVASLNAEANRLAAGTYTAALVFSNTSSGASYTRQIVLTVRPRDAVAAYSFPLDTNPGWIVNGQWQFGSPGGQGSGKKDPLAGHTGASVYGYNLAGDYANSMPTYTLTTTPLDCSNLDDVSLSFWRWLGVEQSYYDKATLEVSNDGVTWTSIWQNGAATIDDGAWTNCTFDISAWADRQPAVYVRWGMGPSDSYMTYCGWNIDDVEIRGRLVDDLVVTPNEGLTAQGYKGGPMNPPSRAYTLRNTGGTAVSWTAMCGQQWVSVAPASGTVAPGATQTVVAAFASPANSLNPGTYTDTITFANTDSGATHTRPVNLTIVATPKITVQPQAFSITVMPEQVATRVMTIGNDVTAGGTLTFSLQISEEGNLQSELAGRTPEPAPSVAAAVPARQFRPVQPGVAFVPNELLVRFAPGSLRTTALSALGGATIAREYSLVDGLALLKLPAGQAVEEAIATLRADPNVLYAEPNYLVHADATTPNDPRFSELWGMHNTGQNSGTPDADIDAPEAWDVTTGSRAIIVAVIDTGVDYTHPDLASNMWRNPGEIPANGLDDDGNGYADDVYGYDFVNHDADPMDDHNHGSHCAGTIGAAGHNGAGIAGVCWQVRIMAMKFLSASGSGDTADAISCIEYATRMGARVMNNSWGGGGFEQALNDAIDVAGASGVVFCAAAGNDGTDNDTTPHYPSSYASENILAVMASDRNDARSSFSCYGAASVDLGAPGSDILSTVAGGSYATMSGTSMATPHAAGACALLLAHNPSLTVAQVKDALMTTVDATLPGVCVAGGRINLARALSAARSPWLTAAPMSGDTLAPGASLPITITASAAGRATGVYAGLITCTCNDVVTPVVNVPVTMIVKLDDLSVVTTNAFTPRGRIGGPFTPASQTYELRNTGLAALHWSATAPSNWVALAPSGGTLAAGATAVVTASLAEPAGTLGEGLYTCPLVFRNTDTGVEQTRPAALTIYTVPAITVTPHSIAVTNYTGVTKTTLLAIGNHGDGRLDFNITPQGASSIVEHAARPQIQSSAREITAEFTFETPSAVKAGSVHDVTIPGLASYRRAGKPVLPLHPVTITVPYGMTVTAVRVEALGVRKMSGAFNLRHATLPRPLSRPMAPRPAPRDEAVYRQEALWPGQWYENCGIQSKRGYQTLRLNLFPVQYAPAPQRLEAAARLRVTVECAPVSAHTVLQPDADTRTYLAARVANPSALATYPEHAPAARVRAAVSPCALETGSYSYVVITDAALAGAPAPYNFQALCDAKTARNVPARIVQTAWIYANYSGADNPARIRNFLMDAYQTWGTRYALLGGTSTIVPARKLWVDSFAGEVDEIPSDLYYGCVEPAACTFDGDGDGKYGEPNDGPGGADVDLSAEIAIGRAPVATAAEVANFVRKTLAYDTTTNAYLPRITMLGEHLGFGGVSEYATLSMEQIRNGGTYDGYFTYGFSNHPSSDVISFDLARNLYDGPQAIWPAGALVALINSNVHVLNHLGHANETYAMKLYTSSLAQLNNSAPCFIYSQGCLPGAFDSANCFAEEITAMQHGAFAAIMNARYGWGESESTDGPSQRFDRQFWDAVFGEDIRAIGRANQDSKEDNLWDIGGECIRWCYYELNLFGDPELNFRFNHGASVDWLSAAPSAGSAAPGGVQHVSVACAAGTHAPGVYAGELAIACNDPYTPEITVPVTMTIIPDPLQVTPATAFDASGIIGGPFTPTAAVYHLSNSGVSTLTWSASHTAGWLALSPASGSLAPGATATLNATITAGATNLAVGLYTDQIVLSNHTTGAAHLRAASLDVQPIPPVPIYEFTFDTDPHWTTQGQWQFGRPLGNGGEHGQPDPTSAHTGTNVYGYNLAGDYADDMPQYFLTTEPLDCSNARNVHVNFWRWLGVEASAYDHAAFQVSRDNTTWTTVWQNDAADVTDAAWTSVSYDISASADGQPAVYLRWSMGATDGGYKFCGWNIDDVTILGTPADDLFVTPASVFTASGHRGGPFAPATTVYQLRNLGAAPVQWLAAPGVPWLSVSPTAGTIATGAAVFVTVAITSAANSLPEGVHSGTLTFSNLVTGFAQQRHAALTVYTSPIVQVTPAAITITNVTGGAGTATLSVGNAAHADAALTFALQVRQTGGAAAERAAAPLHATLAVQPCAPELFAIQTNAAYVPGELLVRFAPAATLGARSAALAALGGATVAREFSLVPGLALVSLPRSTSVAHALATLSGLAGVQYAEPNYIVHTCATMPDDPRFPELWGLNNTGQTGGSPGADINAPEAWDYATGSRNVIVAVIDTGVDYTHPELVSNMWRNPGEIPANGLDDDGNGYADDVYGYDFVNHDADPMDDHSHGTHCSGTIGAAGHNGAGVAGVCWQVRIMAMKFLSASGSGDTADAISCIEYATRMGARVMNNSWGGGGFEQALNDAIDAAGASGVVFCAAAGNDGTDNDTTPHYPSSYASENIIAVMSSDHNDVRSSFSCYGAESVDIGAPGSAILSTVPGGGYSTMSGTSMATPHVAGACALLLAANPLLSVAAVKDALLNTVDPVLAGQCLSGGRMNLAHAVTSVGDPWLSATPLAGTNIAPGAAMPVSVTAQAGELAPGSYHGELLLTCNDRATPALSLPVTMLVVESNLVVTPGDGLVATGMYGGPFTPSNKVFTLTNPSSAPVEWSAQVSHGWLSVLPASGAIATGGAAFAVVALTPAANQLVTGQHSAAVTFTTPGGLMHTRHVQLTVMPAPEPPMPPMPPAGVSASDELFTDRVLITWQASSNAAAYRVYRSELDTTNTAAEISGDLTVLSYDDTNIVPGTVYYYWLRAGNSNGWSAFSAGDAGRASTAPLIDITTPGQSIPYETTAVAIAGTLNNNAAGTMLWENYQGMNLIDHGALPVHTAWSIPHIQLAPGLNEIWVWCTNRFGQEAWDSVVFTRDSQPSPHLYHFTISVAADHVTPILSWSNTPASVLVCTNQYYTRAAAQWFVRATNVAPPWADLQAHTTPSVFYRLVTSAATSAYDAGKCTLAVRQSDGQTPVENWVSSPFDFMDNHGELVPALPFDSIGVAAALNEEPGKPWLRDAVYSQQGVGGELVYATRGNGVWFVNHPSATNWVRNQMYKLRVSPAHTGAVHLLTFAGRVSTNNPAQVAAIRQSDGVVHCENWVAAWFPWRVALDASGAAAVVNNYSGMPGGRDGLYSQNDIGGATIAATRGANTWLATVPAATNLFPGRGYIILINKRHTGPARVWYEPNEVQD